VPMRSRVCGGRVGTRRHAQDGNRKRQRGKCGGKKKMREIFSALQSRGG